MKNKRLFVIAYWIMHLSPIYAVAMMVAQRSTIPAWIALFPMFVIFVPAAAYIVSMKCQHCGAVIYTTDNLKKVPNGFKKIPLHRFAHCPNCHSEL